MTPRCGGTLRCPATLRHPRTLRCPGTLRCPRTLLRLPKENAKLWVQHSNTVREAGSKLYHAAKEKDEASAQQVYRAMLKQCNACHTQFADGKYQLEP